MPRSLLRLAAVSASLVLVWLVWYTLEPRRTAYSCRTFWSCAGFGRLHSYGYQLYGSPLDVSETSATLRDGTIRYQRQAQNVEPVLLVLVLNKNSKSWSSDFRSTRRSFYDFLELLAATRLDLSSVSLGLWTASAEQFEMMKLAVGRLPLAKVTIYFREDASDVAAYEARHNPQVQLARRSGLAKLRNRLMLSALHDEEHILWIDADVVELSKGIVQAMLHHSATTKAAGIITALCHQNQMDNYDKNAWKVSSADLMGPVPDADREAALRKLEDTRLMVPELIKSTDDSALVPLDTVGGTILLIRAELVKQGITFPHFNVVGTTWSQTGWVGVETEGLCYMAREVKGGGCYVLGGNHHARHTDWG